MIYTLPPLPYAADALEPKMSQETVDYHYGKHAQAYTDKLNSLIKDSPYADLSLEELILKADGAIFNNAAQMWNHIFFFESLSPVKTEMPDRVKGVLIENFGSIEEFRNQLESAVLSLFGSGWVWLAEDKDGKLHIIQEPNAGNPMRRGYRPLMTIDVWEHAYYIDCRNRRAEYFDRIWDLTDWNSLAGRLEEEPVIIEVISEEDTAKEVMAEIIEEDEAIMSRYVCIVCGWIYDPALGDPESGIAPGTAFEDIPDDWTCPACGVGKEHFEIER